LSITRIWAYGGESLLAPALLAGIFTIGSAFIVAGLVAVVSGSVAGTTAGLLLLGTAGFQWWGAQQYADVPLATYLAAAIGMITVAATRPEGERHAELALAGALLGFTGWTKTDGVVAAGLVTVLLLLAEAKRSGRTALASTAASVAIGAVLPALAWLAQHVLLTPELAPVMTQGQGGLVAKLTDAGRWLAVATGLLGRAPGRDIWLPAVVVGVGFTEGLRPRDLAASFAFWCATAIVVVDILVFVTTPLDLGFHLLTAGDRLLLQPWPAFVLAVFAAVRSVPSRASVRRSPR
jgi:hypothetical protein